MKTLPQRYLLTSMLALSVLAFAGLGCTRTDETLPAGETTTDLPSETLPSSGVATDDLTSGGTTGGSGFTVDLLPPEEDTSDATGSLTDTTTSLGAADTTGTSDVDTTSSADDAAADTVDLNDLVATPVDDATTSDSRVTLDPEAELVALAEQLVELHGTYTNKDKTPFKNLKDLEPYVTPGMQSYLDTLTGNGTVNPNAPFFGRTTTALSSAVLSQKSGVASVLVTVKREDISGSAASPTTTYAVLRLEFEESAGEWLLDGLFDLDLDKAQDA